MSIYLGAESTARQLSKLYVGVDGKARQVQKIYVGVNGTARLVYQSNTPIGGLAVGSTVKIKVDGTYRDFIVVQQGNPAASIYDASCNGTWLLMKDIYVRRQWNGSNSNNYAVSSIYTYLNSTFLNLFESNIQSAIKQVKIPYRKGSSTSTTVTSGSDGLSTKLFLLSATETSFNVSNMPRSEGAELAYFRGCADSGEDAKRVAKLNGSVGGWWTRSPNCNNYTNALTVTSSGNLNGNYYCTDQNGIRPAMILSDEALVDESYNVIG